MVKDDIKSDLLKIYGPTMTIPDMAEVLHLAKKSIYNKLWKNTFEISVYKLGKILVADTSDVADYIKSMKLVNRQKNNE